LLVACAALPLRAQSPAAQPLAPDNLAIYRDFLTGYHNGSDAPLNVARTTQAFLHAPTVSAEQKTCLSQSHITDLRSPALHRFTPSDLPKGQFHLVNPKAPLSDPEDNMRQGQSVEDAVHAGFAAGILQLSEIVFDPTHTHAAFQYSFICGRLCGSGGILLYDKTTGPSGKPHWKLSTKVCGDWIS